MKVIRRLIGSGIFAALVCVALIAPVSASSVTPQTTLFRELSPTVREISIPNTTGGTFTTYLPMVHCVKSATQSCLVKATLTVSKMYPVTIDSHGGIHFQTAGTVKPNDTPCQSAGRSYEQDMADGASGGQEWHTAHMGAFLFNGCTPPVTVSAQNCWRKNHSGNYLSIQYSLSVTYCNWWNYSGTSDAHAEEDIAVTSSTGSSSSTDSFYQYIASDYFGNIVAQYQSPH